MTNIGNQAGKNVMEDIVMPAIVDFPTVIQNTLQEFGPLFANEPECKHFAEYLAGLRIAHKKTVLAINRAFAATIDQSCLNRWITESNGIQYQMLFSGFTFSLRPPSGLRGSSFWFCPDRNVRINQAVAEIGWSYCAQSPPPLMSGESASAWPSGGPSLLRRHRAGGSPLGAPLQHG